VARLRRELARMSAARARSEALAQELREFAAFGAPTSEIVDEGVPYFVNEFWTSAQRQAHALHEVSYRACFKPQLPQFFIDRLTQPGDAVCDPFMGRGTTPLQAALQRRRPIGSDVNPLSLLLTRPRLRPPTLTQIEERIRRVPWTIDAEARGDLLAFYHPDTLRQLGALRCYLLTHAPLGAAPDPVDDWIRMVALNRLTGHSPGFFSVYTLPPNQAVSVKAQIEINARRDQTPPPRNVAALILKKSRALLADGAPPPHPEAKLGVGEARALSFAADASVRLVVTSPPFLDVVDYAGDNWLRNWFAGVDTAGVGISMHRNAAEWSAMTRAVFEEMARIVAPGGHVAFEVGEVRGGKVLLERLVWEALNGLPFERLFVLVNQQEFTKTSNCWGVANNAKGTNSNRVVVVRRL
jgi:hypothetical protein